MIFQRLMLLSLCLYLGACAAPKPDGPIALKDTALKAGGNRVAVYMHEIPITETHFPGAGCLLCIGVARGAHSELTDQVRSLKPEDLEKVAPRMIETLNEKGAKANLYATKIDVASLNDFTGKDAGTKTPLKDFRPLAKTLGVDKLLYMSIWGQGVERAYSSYFPIDVPKAYVKGDAFMVDLKTNQYVWYWPVLFYRSAEGEWSEPPKYPGLTNAYYQVLAESADAMVKSLSADAPPKKALTE